MSLKSPPSQPIQPARDNPFGSHQFHQLSYRFNQDGLNELVTQFWNLGGRAALVGPHGHGKTTLLLELLPKLAVTVRERGGTIWSVQLKAGQRSLPSQTWQQWQQQGSSNDLFIIDGVEQLWFWNWLRFLRSLGPTQRCLVTAHRSGFLPTLKTCGTSTQLLIELVEQLQGPVTEAQKQLLGELFATHHGNLRECFRQLYEMSAHGHWQQMPR